MIGQSGLQITKPTAIQFPLSFEEGQIVFFNESDGLDGIAEIHYIQIQIGKN